MLFDLLVIMIFLNYLNVPPLSSFFPSADIQQKDREVLELLQERVTLFSDLVEATGRGGEDDGGMELSTSSTRTTSSSSCRNLFRADTPHAPQAEPLLNTSIAEGDYIFFFCFFCDAKTSKVQLKHSVLPVSTVDRLTELLLNSHKSTVTNGNQELSSESAVEN